MIVQPIFYFFLLEWSYVHNYCADNEISIMLRTSNLVKAKIFEVPNFHANMEGFCTASHIDFVHVLYSANFCSGLSGTYNIWWVNFESALHSNSCWKTFWKVKLTNCLQFISVSHVNILCYMIDTFNSLFWTLSWQLFLQVIIYVLCMYIHTVYACKHGHIITGKSLNNRLFGSNYFWPNLLLL